MKILINGHENCKYPAQYVEGLIGFTKYNEDQSIGGILYCNEYIEVIESIQTDRFLITNIDVDKEFGGTNNFIILYHFNAEMSDLKYLGDPLSAQQRIDTPIILKIISTVLLMARKQNLKRLLLIVNNIK